MGADATATTLAGQVEMVMRTSRVLVGVIAASVEEVGTSVTVPQLRVLVMATDHSPLSLGAVADGLGVHPSNATRTCDRLVTAGLLNRRDDPNDRRQVQLTLTRTGQRMVDSVLEHRRAAIESVMARMEPAAAARLSAALGDFLQAAADSPVRPVAVWP